jgi:DNA repair protein RecN (Recombination protein N)
MLHELRVENLLLMERAELALAPGLNVLTGETGAGKTLLAHALDLLLGGRARTAAVREGAAEAYVEGVFSLPAQLQPKDRERIPEGAEEVVLARRVRPDGRTRAYVCGRSATLADLRDLGSRLLAFYGQHEHRKLMLAAAQLDVLDAHCGEGQLALRARVGHAYQRVRGLEQRVAQVRELAGARERELDLVAFELQEIEALSPSEEEERALVAERERLRNLELLRSAAAAGAEAVAPESGAGAAELLAGAAAGMAAAAAADPELAALSERLLALRYEAEDVGGELRSYLLRLERDLTGPADGTGGLVRLEEVQERLAQLARLQRKHGGGIAEVLRHAERFRGRRDELLHADATLQAAEDELVQAREELERLATTLGAARRGAAPELAAAVRDRLSELAMPGARFEVELRARPDGCGPRGADTVEFVIAPNPGLAAGPLREIASGGELSRVMLALLGVAHGDLASEGSPAEDAGPEAEESSPLLVFDEIDAGIGGHTARAVGEHLRALARGRQILCITHLPQVAAFAARHFTIVKDAAAVPARTSVGALAGEQVVGELVRMLGAGEDDSAAGQHARALLRAA